MNKNLTKKTNAIPVVIIAGGKSQRLRINGQLKWQITFGQQSLMQSIIDRISQQSNNVLINGSRNDENALNNYHLPVIYDLLPDYQGPLSGLLTSLDWARSNGADWVITMPCDTPFFPEDLVSRFQTTVNQADHQSNIKAAIARCDQHLHPIFGIWSPTLYKPLRQHLDQNGNRAINKWCKGFASKVDFPLLFRQDQRLDPFFNINNKDDYRKALQLLL